MATAREDLALLAAGRHRSDPADLLDGRAADTALDAARGSFGALFCDAETTRSASSGPGGSGEESPVPGLHDDGAPFLRAGSLPPVSGSVQPVVVPTPARRFRRRCSLDRIPGREGDGTPLSLRHLDRLMTTQNCDWDGDPDMSRKTESFRVKLMRRESRERAVLLGRDPGRWRERWWEDGASEVGRGRPGTGAAGSDTR